MSCYIHIEEVKWIDGKKWVHEDEDPDQLFDYPYEGVAKLFENYTDKHSECGRIELYWDVWEKHLDTVEEEFPESIDEIKRINDWFDKYPDEDVLVCNVY